MTPSVDSPSRPDAVRLARIWAERVAAARASPDSVEVLETLAAGWLAPLLADPSGEDDEAFRQVAFHARNLGASGLLASQSVLQAVFLRDILSETLGPNAPLTRRAEHLIRLAADAHATGASQRQSALARRARIEAAPIIHLPGIAIVGFAAATDDPDLMDSLVGRLLRECAGHGETHAVVDVRGAPTEDPLLHRTLAGFSHRDPGTRYTLVVTGLAEPEVTRAAVADLGARLASLGFAASVETWLTERLHKPSQFEGPLRMTHTPPQSENAMLTSVGRSSDRRHKQEKP